MKKLLSLLLVLAIVCSTMLTLASCKKPSGSNDPTKEEIDESRTQLYVFNFGGGYGAEWLVAAKNRFEALHKDDELEAGKKGVQIMITNKKEQIKDISSQVLDNKEEIYFTEYAYYYTLLSEGILADITDAVKSDLSAFGDAAGSTIEGKLSDAQKDYLQVEGRYYAVPHYSGFSGLVYNIDLFNDKGYFFRNYNKANIESPEDYFVYNSTDTKSAGPDGRTGTYDDGLPATYEEFFILCEYIKQSGDTPIIWNGKNHTSYVNCLIEALDADCDGYEQKMLDYTLSGEATTLGTIVDGKFVKDSSSTVLNDSNALNVFRREGKYQGLSFVEKLIDGNYYYQNANGGSFNTGLTHLDAQDNFLFGGHDGETPNIAMMAEGIWWESEATDTFNQMANSMGSEYAKSARNFGFMPMPKTDSSKVGETNTLIDHIYSLCFMKKNIAEHKRGIALEFIKFVNSNESLVEYTTITNTPKALNYTLTDEQLAKLTTFGRSVLTVKTNSEIVYPYSSHKVYTNHQGQFQTHEALWTEISGEERQFASSAFKDYGVSAEAYFSGIYTYYNKNWKNYFN